MTSRFPKKLDSIQRLFSLYITSAYRTTPTAALQVLTGLQPLHLQIQQEATYARFARARSSSSFSTFIFGPTDYESKSYFLLHNQISFVENHRDSCVKAIYTDGSKTDEGTGRAYCILENYGVIASWQGKLDHSNSVFQAEIFVIRMAIEAASSLHRPNEIWTDSNECADQLAKEAITKGDPFFLANPLSFLKSEIRPDALSIWQDNWNNGETGRSAHDIVPMVRNKPVGWNREELMSITGHGPFPSYIHRFNLRTHYNCLCGGKGDTMHYATKCWFTLSWNFQTPTVSLKLQWLKNILTNNLSRIRLRLLMRFICDESNLIVEDNL
ncbi:hypothetical protein AVEN_37148-1 [Araneus ventricosus]|uniref:RNase H type-1 domain-containing protein n=1 Tax=Araneus ventricosus TaxID=182803 RepID=A0A4Y2NY15_ARAVE|nr:hypothetical protein AVEN_37148-1 [Araneus ventricosus]